jgi:hypothetical protein
MPFDTRFRDFSKGYHVIWCEYYVNEDDFTFVVVNAVPLINPT